MKTVTAAVIVEDGRVLIARRKPGEKLVGMWEFPGGKVEPGESLEELGLVVSVGPVLAESVYQYDHGEIRLVALQAEVRGGKLSLSVHDRVEWVHIRDLAGFSLPPADIPIAERLKEKFESNGGFTGASQRS